MSTTQLPAVVDAVVAAARTALASASVIVSDGIGVTADPGDFLMVGVDDPSSSSPFAGTSDQAMATLGTARSREENGVVTCAAYSWNGNGGEAGQKAARDASFATIAAVEGFLRADPSLGLGLPGYFFAQMGGSTSFAQTQDENGADCLVIFNIAYRARI